MNECVGRARVVSETTMMEFTWTYVCGLCVCGKSVCGIVCPSVYLVSARPQDVVLLCVTMRISLQRWLHL